MSNLEIKAAELIATHKKESSKAFLDTFIFEPENIEEQNLGSLYVIGEITDLSTNSEYLINLLVATIKKEYYSNTGRNPMESLEVSLNKTNEMLADFAEQGNIGWIGNLNIIIAVMKDGTLYFSEAGRAKALLIRDKNVINIGHDLVSELKPHPLKTFSNIANGQIDENDKLIFATSKFSDSISDHELKNIVSQNPDNILDQFESHLKENDVALIYLETKPKTSSFIGIKKILSEDIEKLKKGVEPENVKEYSNEHPTKEDRLDDIISELNAAEAETALNQRMKFLAKAIRFMVDGIKKILAAFWEFTKKTLIGLYTGLKPRVIILGNRLAFEMKNLRHYSSEKMKANPMPANQQSVSFSDITPMGEVPQHNAAQDSAAEQKTIELSQYIRGIKDNLTKNKIVAVIAIILVLAIATSATNWNDKTQGTKNNEQYAALLAEADKAVNDAENDLTYEKYDQAADSIKLALTNTKKLIEADYQTEQSKAIRERALQQMDKMEGTTRIDNPTALVDFATQSKSIKTNGIIFSGKNLYSFNSENNALYKYDFAKKTSQIVAVNSENMGHLKIGKAFDNKMIFLTDSPGVAVYDPSKSELKNVPIKLNENEANIADIATFKSNSSLYLLSKSDGSIYKHLLTASGYAGGSKWLKEEAAGSVQDPVSIAIDGDIFVLQNESDNSAILKFTKGEKKEFTLPSFIIPLKKATKVATSDLLKNIYILDPENKRIIAISKTGNTSKQYTSDKFDNLVDFAINPNEKTLYLLNGTSVYEVGL